MQVYGTQLFPQIRGPTGAFFAARAVRGKFERHFKLDNSIFPRQSVDRWIDNIKDISSKVNPRVLASCIKLGYDGWPCKRRCGISATCFLCDAHDDSTTHIIRCPVIIQLIDRLRICTIADYNPRTALLLCPRNTPIAVKVKTALAMHAAYDLLNYLRHGGKRASNVCKQLLEHVVNAAEGSAFSNRVLLRWRTANE